MINSDYRITNIYLYVIYTVIKNMWNILISNMLYKWIKKKRNTWKWLKIEREREMCSFDNIS